MNKLDRFILKSFLGPFIVTFTISIFILLLQFLWVYIEDLVGKGLGLGIILEFMGWGSAITLPLALPLSCLLASIMTLGELGENNELLAIKAAGVSLQRILAPLFIVAFFISTGAFFVSNNLVPIAHNKIYTLNYDIGRTKSQIKIPTGIFYNGIDGYSLRVDQRDDESGQMYGLMVYDHTKNSGNTSLIVADSGSLTFTEDMSSLIFSLYSGISYDEETTRERKDTTYVLNKVDFTSQTVVIPLENYTFSKSDDSRYEDEVMVKDVVRLKKDEDSLSIELEEIMRGYQNDLIHQTGLAHAIELDTTKKVDFKGNIDVDSLLIWDDKSREIKDLSEAINTVNSAVITVENMDRGSSHRAFILRRIRLEFFRKFALAFACFVFFLIGAPLGAIIRKGGLGTPVIISALFFVMYWVIDISAKKLTSNNEMVPFMGAFISTFVLLPIGIFLTWKSTKDSSMFNPELYISAIKNFFKRKWKTQE